MGNSFGNRIVGKPIDPQKPSADLEAKTEHAVKTLDSQTTRLEKRLAHTETLLKHTRKQAEEAVQRGDKSAAMRLLSRAKEYESSLQSIQGMIHRLVQQRDILEKTKFQTDTLHVMEQVNKHLKQQTATVSTEQAETIIDDINDLKQNADEIMNILTAPIGDSVSQDELEKEYQTMVATQPILLPKPPMPPVALPVGPLPPTGFPVANQTKPTMLEELEAV